MPRAGRAHGGPRLLAARTKVLFSAPPGAAAPTDRVTSPTQEMLLSAAKSQNKPGACSSRLPRAGGMCLLPGPRGSGARTRRGSPHERPAGAAQAPIVRAPGRGGSSRGARPRRTRASPSPPASFSPSPPPSAVLKENKHGQNLPFTVPVRRAGRTKGHCCCTNRGSPDGPSTKAACVPPAASGAEGLLVFWEGAGGDVVLNKGSVRLLAAPRAAPELPPRGFTAPAASPKRLQVVPEPPRSSGSCTPCCGSQHGEGTPWPGWLPLLAGRQKDLQPASRTDREPTLPTLPAPNPPMQSLGAPRARQAGGSQGFVGFCSPSRDPRLRPQRPGKKPVEKKPSTAVLGAGRAQGFGEGQSLRSQDKWHPLRNRSSPGLSPLLSSFSRRPELRLFHLRCRGSSWQAGALQAPPRSAETRAAPEQFLKLRGQGAAATLP